MSFDPNSGISQLSPFSIEAEQNVLGCCLMCPEDCVPKAIARFKGEKLVFYDHRNRMIFEAMVALFDNDESSDLITVHESLKNSGNLDQVGGISYLAQLQDNIASDTPVLLKILVNIDDYQHWVRRRWVRVDQVPVKWAFSRRA